MRSVLQNDLRRYSDVSQSQNGNDDVMLKTKGKGFDTNYGGANLGSPFRRSLGKSGDALTSEEDKQRQLM